MEQVDKNSIPKINQLISEWPNGAVMTMAQLKHKKYSRQLIDKYKSSRWISPIGHGAYRKYNDKVDWFGGIYGLQASGYPVFIGGKTSLELLGLAHYMGPEINRCCLFGETGTRLPKWFLEYPWKIDILYKTTNLFSRSIRLGLTDYKHKEFTVQISAPERGSIEMMYHIPNNQGFDEAFRIMENLATLRSDMVQQLLLNCNSFKVKRLFMYMAQKVHHGWFDQLNPEQIDFGKGKRVILKNGILDNQYQITVNPENTY
ncbi:type IV toxin-antitoxin system AbiEi family antitoxin [candidate division KSB1 bacterium]|nr:type IV toxin-antitoxin system AbiEi family antitoxin [candidate division KSB1 bacterium]